LVGTDRAGILVGGAVSERPKEHASKACVGESPPWVQIPPAPPDDYGPDLTARYRAVVAFGTNT
jgi:hypothetical protein